jgi:hypothetical protein
MPSDGSGRFALTRRSFLKAAVAAGGAAALPLTGVGRQLLEQSGLLPAVSTGPGPLLGGPYFLTHSYTDPATGKFHDLYAIASALCDRILPATTNPVTGAVSPGAEVVGAVNYIDLFMSAFDPGLLSSTFNLVSTNPIWLAGRFSSRYPFGNSSAGSNPESGQSASDDFESSGGSSVIATGIQFLDLTPPQLVSWYLRIYGAVPSPLPSWWPTTGWAPDSTWESQVGSGLVPGAQPLRSMYQAGLSAFDDWSSQNFGTPFASASTLEQDLLVDLASNPVLGAVPTGSLPGGLTGIPSPLPDPVPPPAAAQLFDVMVLHAIQGTYGLPEYRGQSDAAVYGTGLEPTAGTVWADIGWDGDTQPLGSSVYQYDALGRLNAGYSQPSYTEPSYGSKPGAPQPQGVYVEVRPVSSPDESALGVLDGAQVAQWFQGMVEAGIIKVQAGGPL